MLRFSFCLRKLVHNQMGMKTWLIEGLNRFEKCCYYIVEHDYGVTIGRNGVRTRNPLIRSGIRIYNPRFDRPRSCQQHARLNQILKCNIPIQSICDFSIGNNELGSRNSNSLSPDWTKDWNVIPINHSNMWSLCHEHRPSEAYTYCAFAIILFGKNK